MTRNPTKAPTKTDDQAKGYFNKLNADLKPLGFKLHLATIEDPANPQGFHYVTARLWPLPDRMLKGAWITRGGVRQRTNERSFDLAATDKRDFVALALRIATEHAGDLVPNDGHPANNPQNYDWNEQYTGPAYKFGSEGTAGN